MFKRIQFPIKLVFAMTINKAQGQTQLNIVDYESNSNLMVRTLSVFGWK